MKYLASLSLIVVASLVGCAEKTTGPVTTTEELSQYNIHAGEAEKAAAEAAAAAAQAGN